MLTRRGLASFASCAICAASGFNASAALAQVTRPETTRGVKQTILSQTDGPMPGYVTTIIDLQIEAGVVLPRHTHPGIESGYIVEGNFELPIEGRQTLSLMPGNAFQVPPETPHGGGQASAMKVRIASTYVVEKGKALSYPA